MAILMALPNYPDGRPTVNSNHVLNPQRIKFYIPKEVEDMKSPGLGSDGVYRDPWGSPYIITIDANGDGYCEDAFYRRESVSGTQATNGSFRLKTNVMIWSLGPDGMADRTKKGNEGVNKDNILSW